MLELKYSEERGNGVSIIKEMTGTYNAVTNLGGWNAPNEDISSVTAATATYYFADETTLVPKTTGVAINIFPALPSDAAPANLSLTFSQLGITEWQDGWTKIVIDISATAEYSVTIDILSTCETAEALLAFMDTLDFKCCEGTADWVLFNELMAMYNSVTLGFCCDKVKSMAIFADLKLRLSRITSCC
jgi:hypothetical protein